MAPLVLWVQHILGDTWYCFWKYLVPGTTWYILKLLRSRDTLLMLCDTWS